MKYKIILILPLFLLLYSSFSQAQSDTYYYYKVLWTGRFDKVTIPPFSGGEEAIWWADLAPTINVSTVQTAQFPNECSWDGAFKTAIQNALGQWQDVFNSPLNFNFLHNATHSDNYLEIYFATSEDFPPQDEDVGGRAYVAVSSDTRIRYHWEDTMTKHRGAPMEDTQVKLNNTQDFRDFGYSWTDWDPWPDSYTWHVESLVKHELGHTFGLAHNNRESIMNDVKVYPGFTYDVQDYDGEALYWLNFYWQPYYIGVEDYIIITEGPTIVRHEDDYRWDSEFIDYDEPYDDYIVGDWHWQLIAYHSEGSTILDEGYSQGEISTFITLTIPNLDDLGTQNWARDENGYVTGEVKVDATDNDNITHTATRGIGIDTNPDCPVITECYGTDESITLSFIYDQGGYSDFLYEIWYGTESGVYNGTDAEEGTSPIIIYENSPITTTLTGVNNGTTYYFSIRGLSGTYGATDYSNEECATPITTSGLITGDQIWPGVGNPCTINIYSDVIVPDGIVLTIASNATVNLNGNAVKIEPGGTINRDYSSTFNPDIRLVNNGSTLKGQYSSSIDAFTGVTNDDDEVQIYSYETWTGSINAPCNVTVAHSITLNIEPNTTVLFASETGLRIEGKLTADEATFDVGDAFGPWQGIEFTPSADNSSIIDDCDIDEANIGVEIDGAAPTIKYCSITNCTQYGISINSAEPTINNCDIYYNNTGISCYNSYSYSWQIFFGNNKINPN